MGGQTSSRRTEFSDKRSREKRRTLDRAAEICSEVLADGGSSVIADRASTYVSDATWELLRQRHRSAGCEALARLAKKILDGTEKLHSFLAQIVDRILVRLGRNGAERVFARELARRVPLPIQDQLSVAARGLQVAGIWMCLTEGRNMIDCSCMRSIVDEEGRECLELLLRNALQDWQNISVGLPQPTG